MVDIGWADLEVRPDVTGFESRLGRGLSGQLDSAGRSGGRRYGAAFGRAAALGIGAVAVGAFKLGKDSIGLASDLGESLNAVNISYGKQSNSVKRLGREAAQSLGLSNEAFNSLSVRFSSFSTTIAGGPGRKVVTTLDDLTTRASDFASVMNLEVNEAAGLFQSGLAGETEPLRQFGIDLSAAAVQTHAYAEGIAASGEELTEAEKVQARYSLLMEQTAKTQGDFKNTSGELANQQRILSAEWDNARARLGTALLPAMKDVSGFLLNEGIPAFEDASDWFVRKGIPAIGDFAAEVKPLAQELLPAVGDVLGTTRDVLKDALPYVKDFVGAFNDMPDWAKKAIVGGALLGGAGLKIKGGLGNRGGGVVGGLLGSVKPVPVIVMNKGFGAGDLPGGGGKGGKGGFLSSAAKLAIPFALGYELDKHFPKAMPLGGWLPGTQDDADPRLKVGGWQVMLNDLFGGGEEAVHDFGDAMTDTIPLAELLGGEVTHTGQSVSFLSDRFKALPDGVETAIKTPGLIQSQADVMDLKRKYDLTPREVKTVLRALGIDEARNKAEALKRAMDLLRDKHISVTTTYYRRTEGGKGPVLPQDTPAPKTGGGPAGRQAVVINLPDGRQLDGYVDDRIHAVEGLKGQRR